MTIVNNPWLVGIAVTVIGGVILYFVFNKRFEPMYAISKSSSIASTAENSDITILFKGEAVENLRTCRLLIWNGGNKGIDVDDISTDYPLSLRSPNTLLDLVHIKSSRPSLDVNITGPKQKQQDGDYSFELRFQGPDVIEPNDYVLYHILYSGTDELTVMLQSRVFGTPSGFSRVQWDQLNPNIGLEIAYFVLGGFGLILLIYPLKEFFNTKNKKDRIEIGFFSLGVLVGAILCIYMGFPALVSYSKIGSLIIN